MSFTHEWLDRHSIIRIDNPTGRKYETPEGNKYESVTTWLGRIQDSSWIEEWKNAIGEEEAEKIVRRAATRGTVLHEGVERHLRNEVVTGLNMLDRIRWVAMTKVLNKKVNRILALEYPLYSNALRLAGTVDCVAYFEGVLSIIDFKTSKNRKDKADIDSYFLQCAIYSYMIEELYKIKIDKLVILMALDNEDKVQVFEDSRKNWSKRLIQELKKNPPK